jgi:hypothetical protein
VAGNTNSKDAAPHPSEMRWSCVSAYVRNTISNIQWNRTHQGTREMCQFVEDVGILRFYFS